MRRLRTPPHARDPCYQRGYQFLGRLRATGLVARALPTVSTCTGEHGVGYGKAKYMKLEHGNGVRVMRTIKQALDPADILNPGKILPED